MFSYIDHEVSTPFPATHMAPLAAELQRVARWTSTLWFASVLAYLSVEFLRGYSEAVSDWSDDTYTAALCADNHVRASLGKNAAVCEDAAAGLALPPWQTAVARTASLVHLCGLTSCADFIGDVTRTLTGTVLLVAVVVSVPTALFLVARWTAPPLVDDDGRWSHRPGPLPLAVCGRPPGGGGAAHPYHVDKNKFKFA